MSTPKEELNGVVSLDLRREPDFPLVNSESAARALVVQDEESYRIAAQMIQQDASVIAKVEAFFEEDRRMANALHKSITSKIAKFTAPFRTTRPILEPKMLAYRRKQEEEKRAEEARRAREAAEAQRKADQEAAEIKAKADAEAAALRRAGDVRAARELQAQAAAQAQQAAVAQQVIEVIPADFKPMAAGVGERRPWVARVTDPMVLIRAVAEGKVPLMHTIPVRTKVNGKFQDVMTAVPVVEINMSVLHYAAKRLGMENIGFPGAVGERDFGLSFRKTDDPGPQEEY